jgi:hypothetical protein
VTTRADRRGVLRRASLTRQALPFTLDRYTVATLPAAARWEGAQVHVSDETDGAVTCFSDGINWRRITDRAIVSATTPTRLSAGGATSGEFATAAGPYLQAAGVAVGTFSAAAYLASAMSAAGSAAGPLQTPPKVPTDLSATGAGTGAASASCLVSVGLTGIGAASATLYGEAA